MSATPLQPAARRPRFVLALAGLVLALVSPVFWALTLDNNVLQRTGLAMWTAMAVGLACAALAAWRDRRRRTGFVATLTGVWVLLCVSGYFALTRLPAPQDIEARQRVADFTLPDQMGEPTTLSDMLREKSVLLVFYRGYW